MTSGRVALAWDRDDPAHGASGSTALRGDAQRIDDVVDVVPIGAFGESP